MKKKLVIIHPAIAPYRIDFFNSMNEAFEMAFYSEFEDVLEQSFDRQLIQQRLHFTPKYLKPGFAGLKNLRLDIFKVLKKEKPEIVFCSEYNVLSFLILAYKFLFNRNLYIYTLCDDSLEIARTCKGIRKWMRSILIRLFNGIIMSDQSAVQWYKQHLNSRATLIYFPIVQDDEVFRSRLKEAIPTAIENKSAYHLDEKIVLLYVGRLAEVKNLSFLLNVFHQLSINYDHLALVLVGDGPLKIDLQIHAEMLGIQDRVIFTGKLQGTELSAWYNLSDLFILPSYYEPFGTVVNEALLAGCYVLCSSLAGAAGLIEAGKNGQLFDPFQEADLLNQLADPLKNIALKDPTEIKPNRMILSYNQLITEFLKKIN